MTAGQLTVNGSHPESASLGLAKGDLVEIVKPEPEEKVFA